jgi:hypothetical protein
MSALPLLRPYALGAAVSAELAARADTSVEITRREALAAVEQTIAIFGSIAGIGGGSVRSRIRTTGTRG